MKTLKLTNNDFCVLSHILDLVVDNLEWDEDFQQYKSDYENWMCLLDKKDKKWIIIKGTQL